MRVRYIVEARHETSPSLYSVTPKGMAEVDKKKATRYDEATAREIAENERRLRGRGRRIILIKVKE